MVGKTETSPNSALVAVNLGTLPYPNRAPEINHSTQYCGFFSSGLCSQKSLRPCARILFAPGFRPFGLWGTRSPLSTKPDVEGASPTRSSSDLLAGPRTQANRGGTGAGGRGRKTRGRGVGIPTSQDPCPSTMRRRGFLWEHAMPPRTPRGTRF